MLRLDKYLADCGIGTRNEVKKYIKQGCVNVSGTVIKDSAFKVDENALVKFCGKTLAYQKYTYLMLNKPTGVISATKDKSKKTVIDILPSEYKGIKLFPVGRLDKDTTGLLILTNDGDFAHSTLSPKKHVQKTYYVEAQGSLEDNLTDKFKQGITLEDGTVCKEAILEIIESEPLFKARLTIIEGKFHQVKRMFKAVGGNVTCLKRLSFGELTLDITLSDGECRPLNQDELSYIKKLLRRD